jgi:hypothetical protein
MPIANITETQNPIRSKLVPIKEKQDILVPGIVDQNIPNRNGMISLYNDSQDEAHALRWLMLLTTKRIIVSNEIKSTYKIDSNAIKKMSSGGKDLIVARGHGGNETEFPFTALAIVNSNDACEITPKDDALSNRLKSFTYNKPYVSEITNPEFELLADPNVDTEISTLNFKLTFLNLLMTEYKEFLEKGETEPDEIAVSTHNWFGVSKTATMDTFLDDYEITGNDMDYVKSSDVQDWIDDKKLKISITKLASELNKHCTINDLQIQTGLRKKVNNKTIRCWFGIKLIPYIPDSIPELHR